MPDQAPDGSSSLPLRPTGLRPARTITEADQTPTWGHGPGHAPDFQLPKSPRRGSVVVRSADCGALNSADPNSFSVAGAAAPVVAQQRGLHRTLTDKAPARKTPPQAAGGLLIQGSSANVEVVERQATLPLVPSAPSGGPPSGPSARISRRQPTQPHQQHRASVDQQHRASVDQPPLSNMARASVIVKQTSQVARTMAAPTCARKFEVNWDLVDTRLPTGDDPASRQRRKLLFDRMDPNHNGLLSLSECLSGFPPLLDVRTSDMEDGDKTACKAKDAVAGSLVPLSDFKPAIKNAFKAAQDLNHGGGKKGKVVPDSNAVDRYEFHALLVAFRLYLELDVLFSIADTSQDRLIDFKECEKVLPQLESWGITRNRLQQNMPDESSRMRYDDFCQLCIRRRVFVTGQDLDLHLEDLDDSPEHRSVAAGGMAMRAVGRFATAPASKRGKHLKMPEIAKGEIPEESVDSAGREVNPMRCLRRVTQHSIGPELAKKLEKVSELFKEYDKDNSGSISHDELTWLLQKLSPGITRKEVEILFGAADADGNGEVDYEEFLAFIFKGL